MTSRKRSHLFMPPLIGCLVLWNSFVRAHGQTSGPVQWTPEAFRTEVPSPQAHFILFYAPWCSICKKLKPTWDAVSRMVASDAELRRCVLVGQVDCELHNAFSHEMKVERFPDIRWLPSSLSQSKRELKYDVDVKGIEEADVMAFIQQNCKTSHKSGRLFVLDVIAHNFAKRQPPWMQASAPEDQRRARTQLSSVVEKLPRAQDRDLGGIYVAIMDHALQVGNVSLDFFQSELLNLQHILHAKSQIRTEDTQLLLHHNILRGFLGGASFGAERQRRQEL